MEQEIYNDIICEQEYFDNKMYLEPYHEDTTDTDATMSSLKRAHEQILRNKSAKKELVNSWAWSLQNNCSGSFNQNNNQIVQLYVENFVTWYFI